MQLQRIVRFRGRHIGFVEFNWRACESALGVSTFALQARRRTDCSGDHVGFVVGLEIGFDVRLLRCVRDMYCVRCGLGCFKCVRYCECYVLAVIPNSVIFEWRPSLVTDALESYSWHRTENLSYIVAAKYRSHVRQFLSRNGIEFG